MSDTRARGGFTGDPAAAFTAAGTGGCCGTPPQATLALPDPAEAAAGRRSAGRCRAGRRPG
jgi:hypothetical protein